VKFRVNFTYLPVSTSVSLELEVYEGTVVEGRDGPFVD